VSVHCSNPQVKVPFNFTDKSIATIHLPDIHVDNEYSEPGRSVTAVGWDRINVSKYSDTLQEHLERLKLFCSTIDFYLFSHFYWPIDTCHGDSSGLLMFFSHVRNDGN
jgi:hypothetical protein